MNAQMLGVLIPLIALAIPVLAVTFWGLTKLASVRAEQHARLADGEALHRVAALEEQVAVLHQQLSETQERLDFAERLLSRPREEGRPH